MHSFCGHMTSKKVSDTVSNLSRYGTPLSWAISQNPWTFVSLVNWYQPLSFPFGNWLRVQGKAGTNTDLTIPGFNLPKAPHPPQVSPFTPRHPFQDSTSFIILSTLSKVYHPYPKLPHLHKDFGFLPLPLTASCNKFYVCNNRLNSSSHFYHQGKRYE